MLLAAAALAWTLFVLAFYYSQLWRLLLGDWLRAEPQTAGILVFIGSMLLLAAAAAGLVLVVGRRVDRHTCTRVGRIACLVVVALVALGFLALTLVMAQSTTDLALPYLHAALKRESAGIGATLLLLAAAVALGLGISRALGWQYAGWRERLPFGGALGIGAFGTLGLLLAQVGLYRPYVLQTIAALVLLVALFMLTPSVLRQVRSGRQLSLPPMPPNTTVLWITCAGLALFCAGVAALAPETQYDALWYHLTYPQRYLQAGYLVDVPADFVSLYPMTTELWYGYGLALGGATAAILLHFGYLLLAAMLTYEFTRRYAPGAAPWLAVALLFTIPTIIWLGSTADTDLAISRQNDKLRRVMTAHLERELADRPELVEAVRQYSATRTDGDAGWLNGLRDPYVGRALTMIHGNIGKDWSAEDLAKDVALSRSAFVDRFTSLVGMPPIRYLTFWRLHTAKLQLREKRTTIAQLAHVVGYRSEEAFSRAFKREFGVSPGQWRDQPAAG